MVICARQAAGGFGGNFWRWAAPAPVLPWGTLLKRGIDMEVYPANRTIMTTALALFMSLVSCSSQGVVRGRVVDADTRQPIKGAAVAIRWYTAFPAEPSAKTDTYDAVQTLSDSNGEFKLPQYPEKKYTLGIYKSGYVCWSSRDLFGANPKTTTSGKRRHRMRHQITDGMQVALERLGTNHPKDIHAGFTVMVAGETTDTDWGPFHRAIEPEYQLWRNNLRKDFQKQVGTK